MSLRGYINWNTILWAIQVAFDVIVVAWLLLTT